MNNFISVIRRFHGTRCIIRDMTQNHNLGRDVNTINQLINEANRQKLEARIVEAL